MESAVWHLSFDVPSGSCLLGQSYTVSATRRKRNLRVNKLESWRRCYERGCYRREIENAISHFRVNLPGPGRTPLLFRVFTSDVDVFWYANALVRVSGWSCPMGFLWRTCRLGLCSGPDSFGIRRRAFGYSPHVPCKEVVPRDDRLRWNTRPPGNADGDWERGRNYLWNEFGVLGAVRWLLIR